ncbi:MAG: InlB B-repeat-containing protein [Acholeplasmatales bacterium]|nr:InlB B-repeat-containing protein [Acholeplasmatales bacterium]
MNKFKKVLLGALSALTLGLFVVTGAKVNATAKTANIMFCDYTSAQTNLAVNDLTVSWNARKSDKNGVTFVRYDNNESVTPSNSATSNVANFGSDTDYISITSSYAWNGKFSVYSSGTNNDTLLFNSTNSKTGTSVVTASGSTGTTSKTLCEITVSDVPAGTVYIFRSGSKELKCFQAQISYNVPDYKITYSTEQGTAPNDIESTSTLTNDMLASISATGYQFNGWYLDQEHTIPATTSSVLSQYASNTGVVTLYADWVDLNATYNVTFMNGNVQYGDVISIPYDSNYIATIGDSMPNNPTKDGYIFDGWYTADGTNNVWGNKVTSSTEITASMVNNKAITLYAKFSVDPVVNATFDKYAGFSSLPTSNIENDISDVVINAYLTAPGSKSYFVKAKTNKTTFNDNVTLTNQVQTKRLVLTLSTIAKVDIYAQQTGSASRTIEVINTKNGNVVGSFIPSGTSNKNVFTIYLAPGTYNLDGYEGDALSNINFFGVIIDTSKKLSDNVSSEIHTQYNNNTPALADKLRLIGYIDGVTDVADITSVTINATVTRSSDSKVATLSYSINKLFQSFNDDYTATTGRYYAVVIINDIDDLIADTTNYYTLSTLSITVTFDDTSSVTSTGFKSFKIGE